MGQRRGFRVTITDRSNNRRIAAFNITGGTGAFSTGSTRPSSLRRKKTKAANPKRSPRKKKSTPGLEGFALKDYAKGIDK